MTSPTASARRRRCGRPTSARRVPRRCSRTSSATRSRRSGTRSCILDRAPRRGAQARRAKEVIHRQTEHLTRLVDDLLDVTRISRGKIELRRARVEIADVVRRTVRGQPRRLLERAASSCTLDLPLGAGRGSTATRRASRRSSATCSTTRPSSRLRVGAVSLSVASRDGWARVIRVTDTGGGIDPELARAHVRAVRSRRAGPRANGGRARSRARARERARRAPRRERCALTARVAGGGASSWCRCRPRPAAREPLAPARHRGDDEATGAGDRGQPRFGQSLADVLELGGHRAQVARDGRTGIEMARRLKPTWCCATSACRT